MGSFVSLDNGEQVFVEDRGAGSAGRPVLVCLHGLGGASYFFSGIAATLQNEFRVLAIDLPGSGFSPCGANCSFEHFSAVIVETVRKCLRSAGPVVLLGHSMGTIAVLKTLGRGELDIAGLIFVGGLPEPLPIVKERLRKRALVVRRAGMRGFGDAILPVIVAKKFLREQPDKAGLIHRLLETNNPEAYADLAEELAKTSAVEHISKIAVPCLALTGDEDLYAPPPDMKAFVGQIAPRANVDYHVFAECGHLPFFETPLEFNQRVSAFLRGLVK